MNFTVRSKSGGSVEFLVTHFALVRRVKMRFLMIEKVVRMSKCPRTNVTFEGPSTCVRIQMVF